MDDEEYEDEHEHELPGVGILSPTWVARVVSLYAPKANLFRGMTGMIEYIESGENFDTVEMLDYFVQHTVNGFYEFPWKVEDEATPNSNGLITEDEIQTFLDKLNGEGGDDE